MARFVAGVALGLALGVFGPVRAEPSEDVQAAVADAGVDPTDLEGALSSLADAGIATTPAEYLCSTDGLLCPPAPAVVHAPIPPPAQGCGWPICGPLGQRIYCVEGIESTHGAHMYNPRSVWNGEHAQGWLGFLPSTARRWGAVIGNRGSEWNAAAAMIRASAGRQFAGIAWGTC